MHFSRHYKKAYKKKVEWYFKHDDHVSNQDCSSYFLSRVFKYISNIGKISIFFSLLKENLCIYKATNAVRNRMRCFWPNLLIMNFILNGQFLHFFGCFFEKSTEIFLYGKCRHQEIWWKSLHFRYAGDLLIYNAFL